MTLDFMCASAFSQTMRLNSFQIESLAKKIIAGLDEKRAIQFRDGKEVALKKTIEIIEKDFDKEKQLEQEVHARLDQLEKEQSEGFDRHRMFKMLKKKMAEEKRIVL
jgi:hypothetical protein